ncbi:MAG: DUF4783 domain-containing protein [Saprospiraceae bacterium]|jgi:hypothetical protein|nr:DUF4783 domain-containing protein [Saprospiraceae bacterium]
MNTMLSVLLLSVLVNTQEVNLNAITKAISEGNAEALGQYFDQSVEVSVLDNEDVYAKAQAIKVVKDFFAQNKPKSFSQVHQGTSKGNDSQYCIGNLVTATGTFRVYIYLKVSGNNYTIQELRFDEG